MINLKYFDICKFIYEFGKGIVDISKTKTVVILKKDTAFEVHIIFKDETTVFNLNEHSNITDINSKKLELAENVLFKKIINDCCDSLLGSFFNPSFMIKGNL